MKIFTRIVCIGIWIMACSAGIAQKKRDINDIKTTVQTASASALDFANTGDAKSAVELLHATLEKIPAEKKNNTYRAFLYFNLGYIYRNYGYTLRTDHLLIAIRYYRQALSYQPDDRKILNNLILLLQETGDIDIAVEYLSAAIQNDPSQDGQYYAALGDMFRAQGLNDQAWEYYKKAFSASNPNREAGRKLVDLYDVFPASALNRLYTQCAEFETLDEKAVARLGYTKILDFNYTDAVMSEVQQEIYTASLLRWVAISAELGFVSPMIFSNAGLGNSISAPIQELQALLRGWLNEDISTQSEDEIMWWRKDARRYFYLLAFKKSFGDNLMRNGHHTQAIVIYESVLNELWSVTDFSTEIYGRPDVLMTDVLVALARAYNNPKLNMDEKWGRLENRLFQMKGGSYASRDLVSMQKFHTILGQIYFERGELTGFGATNAEFQLGHAIDIAEERAAKDPSTYYPIPSLYQKLGVVFQTAGRNDDAYDALVQAATGYLEADHLRKCDKILKEASEMSVVGSDARTAKFQAVQAIYDLRAMIPTMRKEQFDPSSPEYFQKNASFNWLQEKSKDESVNSDVLKRQRFKILSDLSLRAASVGATETSTKLSSDARQEMKNVKVLSSQQDVVRMRKLEVTSAQFTHTSDQTYKGELRSPGVKEKSYMIATPPGSTAQEVLIDQEALKRKRAERSKGE